MACEADVRSMASVDAMVSRAIETFGHLDVVVNNAGIIADRSLKKMTEEEWRRVIETNLTGVYHVCKSIVERLADGGRIVNLSSISAIVGFFGQVNYAASKAGVIGRNRPVKCSLDGAIGGRVEMGYFGKVRKEEGGSGRLPVLGKQFMEILDRVGRQSLQNISQIGKEIHAMALAGGDHRIDDRCPMSALVASIKQVVLPSDHHSA